MNWQMTWTVSAPTTSVAQWFCWNASRKVRRRPVLETAAKRLGAKRFRGPSADQESVQKSVAMPSPGTTDMLTAAIARTAAPFCAGNLLQGRAGSDLLNHSHRSRRAKPTNRRSDMPSPPSSLGLQTPGQATLQRPPPTESAPTQRNALRRLSICLIAQSERQHAMLTCTGIAERTALVSRVRPASVRSPAFQVGMRAATVSINTCSWILCRRPKAKGMPRYLQGKAANVQGNSRCAAATSSSSHRMGDMTHLSTFVINPDAPANRSRICRTHSRSSAVGAISMTRSSAYKDARCAMTCPGRGERAPRRSASLVKELSASITITKSMGEIGSPCRSPLAWAIRLPVLPFTSIFVLAVESNKEIQLVQCLEKPMCCRTSRRNGQATESNAFAMSTLSSSVGKRLQCSHLQASWTARKLSCKDLPLMNVVWYFKRKQKNPQAHGYRCSFHTGVFQSIDFPQGTWVY